MSTLNVERLATVICATREPAVVPDTWIADDECRAWANRVVAEYARLTEADSPLGHGTPVPEEAELPSGDARIEAL